MMDTLETTSKRTDDNKVELTVSFTAEDVQKRIDVIYKDAGKARIPGFRSGKAPRHILENYYGGKTYFLAQATDGLINDSLSLAIDQEGYVPLDKPSVAEIEPVEEGKDYSYTTVFTVRPLLTLNSYDPVQIELPGEEPTEEEIEGQINSTLQYYVDFKEITDRPVQENDFLSLDLEISSDSGRIDSLCGEGLHYEMSTTTMPVPLDTHLVGMKIGETKEFDLSLSPEEASRIKGDMPSHVIATVKQIKEYIKPELTDEWVKEKIEFDSVQDFRDRITEMLKSRKSQQIGMLRERLAIEELASRLEGEPTDILVMLTEQDMYRDFFSTLQRNNLTFDAYLANANITPAAFREETRKEAVAGTTQALALDALARHLGFEITEEEIREEFSSSGTKDPEALMQQWKDNGRISEIRDGLLRIKASVHVIENAVVFEPGKKPAAKKPAKKAVKAEKAEKGEKDASTTKADKAVKAEKAEKADKAVKTEKAAKTVKADKTATTDKTAKTAKADKTAKAEKGNTKEKA